MTAMYAETEDSVSSDATSPCNIDKDAPRRRDNLTLIKSASVDAGSSTETLPETPKSAIFQLSRFFVAPTDYDVMLVHEEMRRAGVFGPDSGNFRLTRRATVNLGSVSSRRTAASLAQGAAQLPLRSTASQ
jgi:hypothetical protein